METVQSFDAQFEEDSQTVLLNFKNLLFAFRWNKQLTINYLQWLITVVNDCVFYFIKKQEPVYAFHTLVLAEFYVKKILHKTAAEKSLFDLTNDGIRLKKKEKKELGNERSTLLDKFVNYTQRMCDPT